LQILGVEQNYSKTSYSEVKFPEMEHFYQKKQLTKSDISQNVHLGFFSNFAKINFNIWTTSSITKTRGILLHFKMASDLKMAVENSFFDHNSVNMKKIYVLFFAICKSSYNTNFIEEKFFVRYKLASEIKNGG
jgi:hypothetical protein